jgi:hypothetical protein
MSWLSDAWPAKVARSREGEHVNEMSPTLKVRLMGYVVQQHVCQVPRPRRCQCENKRTIEEYYILYTF